MPFTIKKNDKGKFCVYKKDAEGGVTGGTLGCHKRKKDAVAQIGAVESELKRRGKKSADVNFVQWVGEVEKTTNSPDTVTTVDWADTGTIWIDARTNEIIYDVKGLNEDMDESEDTEKAESIDAYRDMVSGAWYLIDNYDTYISEIFDEFIIIHNYKQKAYFKVAYSVDGEDVEFVKQNEWVEVKLKKEWVDKSFNLFERLKFEDYLLDDDEQEPEPDDKYNGYAIKSLGENRIGGYAVLWGDDENKDLDEEFFTAETKDLTVVFDEIGTLPFMVHHAAEDKIVKFVGGAVDVLEPDDIGVWWEARVKEFEAYKEYVAPMMEKGMAYTSSGTFPRAKRTEKNGFISRWPIAEISATWLPAEYRMLEHPISEVKSAYEKLGIEVDLSDYDDDKKLSETDTVNLGVEKARLKELVEQELIKFKLLQIELGE